MVEYVDRTYRNKVKARNLISFHVVVKETDLWLAASHELVKETRDLILECRHQIEAYIQSNPIFLTTLQPYPEDPYAPPLIQQMIQETSKAGVGPMASVAGAVAQHVAKGLLEFTDQVIVENGGDIFLKVNRDTTISIFAGESPLSYKIGILVPERQMPLGICSSSGTVGHSLSMGVSDVVCLLSSSAILADGAATAIGNRIKIKNDLDRVPEWANIIDGILGGVAIVGDRMATWGDIELVSL